MSVVVASRADLNLANYQRVAWNAEGVMFAASALERMTVCRASFLALLDAQPDLVIYGVTSGYGQNACQRFSPEQRRAHAAQPPVAGMTGVGPTLPERISRGIVFARLANFVEGNSAISPVLAERVAALLDGEPLPPLPSLGIQSAGEILALSHLLGPLASRVTLAEKDMLSLINGSPCASALASDAVLAARNRLALAHQVFALSLEAMLAPLEAYDVALDGLWGDPHEAASLCTLRTLVHGGSRERRPYQAPVSWRILPRVLGQAGRAVSQAAEVAESSLRAVTDNPVYVPADAVHPHGRVLSNGGYHNARVSPALDALSASWADLALLCDRHVTKLLDARVSLLPAELKAGSGYVGCLGFSVADCAERARNLATRTPLPGSEGGGFGQNDVAAPVFSAWDKCIATGALFDDCLAMLAAVASQAFAVTGRDSPPALTGLLQEVRGRVPPLADARALGVEVQALAEQFSRRVLPA